jgi:hypothetical protein
MSALETGLSITKDFIAIGKELANLPSLVLPQYQPAAADLYAICQKILAANENTARWFHRFRYFDLQSPSARSDFLAAVQEYRALRSGSGFKQLKFSCGDISQIYYTNISSKLSNWFVTTHKQEQAQGVFERLTDADNEMVDFIQEQVLKKLDDFLQNVEDKVDTNSFNEAEQLRLEFKSATKDVVKYLEDFSDDLSELVVSFAKIAKIPVTLP